MQGLSDKEKLIVQIVNPHSNYATDNITPKELPSDFINSNKLSLLLRDRGIKTKESQKDWNKYKHLINEICKIKYYFSRYNIDFILIKFPKLPKPHSDIDILIINDNDMENVEKALKQIGYEPVYDAERYRRGYFKILNGIKIGVDLHLEISWRGIVYLKKEEIFKNKVEREINGVKIPVPSPEYELLISAAHSIFKDNKITLFDVLYIHSIIKENDINMESVKVIAKQNGWYTQFLYFLNTFNKIYSELYEEGNNIPLPYCFPFHVVLLVRLRKIFSDLKLYGLSKAIIELWEYSLDIVQYFCNKFGISSEPLFNLLKFIKKEVLRR